MSIGVLKGLPMRLNLPGVIVRVVLVVEGVPVNVTSSSCDTLIQYPLPGSKVVGVVQKCVQSKVYAFIKFGMSCEDTVNGKDTRLNLLAVKWRVREAVLLPGVADTSLEEFE